MVKYGKNNIFICDQSDRYGISSVLNFYDLSGENIIYFCHISMVNSGVHKSSNTKKINYGSFHNLPDLIMENIFRATLIVVEPEFDIISIKSIRDITDIPIIIIQKDYETISNFTKLDYVYKFFSDKKHMSPKGDQSMVRNVRDGWESSLGSLFKSLNRSDKINKILGSE